MRSVLVPASNDGSGESQDTSDPGSSERDENAAVLTKLTRTIEGELIPRLLLAHAVPGRAKRERISEFSTDPSEIVAFGQLILACDSASAFKYVEEARNKGIDLEAIITKLLAPAASYLGELWKADKCSFTEVTVGLSRLRQMLRDLGPEFENETGSWKHGRRALLMPVPGEQHTFGLYVVEAFFRREGWDVHGGPVDTEGELTQLVEKHWFAIAGFSLSSERFLERLPSLIRLIRRKSCNGAITVLVGGSFFTGKPALVSQVGADGGATEAAEAVAQAGALLGRLSALSQ